MARKRRSSRSIIRGYGLGGNTGGSISTTSSQRPMDSAGSSGGMSVPWGTFNSQLKRCSKKMAAKGR